MIDDDESDNPHSGELFDEKMVVTDDINQSYQTLDENGESDGFDSEEEDYQAEDDNDMDEFLKSISNFSDDSEI